MQRHEHYYTSVYIFILKTIAVILIPDWNEQTPFVKDGPFEENYVFSRIHFHWGQTVNGSEHTVDGVR